MTTFPDVDICGSWATTFEESSHSLYYGNGRIENPLTELLRSN